MSTLINIAKISSGQGAPQKDSDYSSNGYTFIKASDLDNIIFDGTEIRASKITAKAINEYNLKLYPSNSIIFAKSGVSCTKNRIYVTKSPSYIVNHLCIIYNLDSNIDANWLSLYLKNYNIPEKLIKNKSYPSLTLSDINNIEIPYVPINEQIKVADNINKINNLIKLKSKEIFLFDELIKSRYILQGITQ